MSAQLLIEVAEKAFWKGLREAERRKSHGKPGEFFASLPEDVRQRLTKMKSSDFSNVRLDAIKHMFFHGWDERGMPIP